MPRRNGVENDSVSANDAIISNHNLPYQLGTRADQHPIADTRSPAPTTTIAQSHSMINRTVFSDHCCRMNNDAAEVMDPQALSNCGLSRKGNSGDDFDEALNKKTERLRGNPTFVKPAKDSVNEERLKPLGKQPPNQRTDRIVFLPKAINVSPNRRPKRRSSVLMDV